MKYDLRHGSPYDRGSADAYYDRPFEPHYYEGATYQSKRVAVTNRDDPAWQAYRAGYHEHVLYADLKQY